MGSPGGYLTTNQIRAHPQNSWAGSGTQFSNILTTQNVLNVTGIGLEGAALVATAPETAAFLTAASGIVSVTNFGITAYNYYKSPNASGLAPLTLTGGSAMAGLALAMPSLPLSPLVRTLGNVSVLNFDYQGLAVGIGR